ncbi:carboxypeptidase regulatory-like domain-containing protein, partial [Arthrobacter oryzae]
MKKTSASTAAVTAVPVLSPAPVPSITGSAKVGSVLTAVPGTWGPAPVVLKYQWRADGVVVLGANSATLTLSSARLGKTMSVSVTGSKTGYTSVKKTSASTAAVTAVPVLSPAPVPTVTGSAKVGSTLTVVSGAWGPAPVVLSYQWRADGVAILGATKPTLTLSSARLGKTLTVSVTGSKTGFTSVKKTSAATAAVTAAVPALSPAPVPSITGSAKVGSVLTAVPGTWGPAPGGLKDQWGADG